LDLEICEPEPPDHALIIGEDGVAVTDICELHAQLLQPCPPLESICLVHDDAWLFQIDRGHHFPQTIHGCKVSSAYKHQNAAALCNILLEICDIFEIVYVCEREKDQT
jgi:hypothetical protein